MTTIQEIRDELDGSDKGFIPDKDLMKRMRKSRIIAAYCPDNRNVFVFGYAKGVVRINQGFSIDGDKVISSDTDDDEIFLRAIRNRNRDDLGPVRLSFEINADHEVFSIIEDDELFSLGVIFQLEDKI